MKTLNLFVGIDIAKDDFASSIYSPTQGNIATQLEFTNDMTGFEQLESWLIKQHASPSNSVVCLEATGVYGEALCFWLAAKGYRVAVEPPLKVKRAFKTKDHKNDAVDSRKIAEYACRFADELKLWRPPEDAIERLKVLLMAREQLVVQKTAWVNTLKALRQKVVQTPLANKIYEENIARFNDQIETIMKEIRKEIDQHPDFKNIVRCLDTIPGVGSLLAANFLVATDGFKNELAVQYRKAAAFIGICPYEHTSGSSVYKRPRCPKYGPARLRKLLHLAARTVVAHNPSFQSYYVFKQNQGKPNSLILNNVANKILKLMCSLVRTQRPYVVHYISVNPHLPLINT
jgi:transposase